MTIKLEMGRKLKLLRVRVGLSQQEVADNLGLSKVAYGDFERGRTAISPEHLVKLPSILGVPITDLLPDSVLSDYDRNRARDPLLDEIISRWRRLPQSMRESMVIMARSAAGDEDNREV